MLRQEQQSIHDEKEERQSKTYLPKKMLFKIFAATLCEAHPSNFPCKKWMLMHKHRLMKTVA